MSALRGTVQYVHETWDLGGLSRARLSMNHHYLVFALVHLQKGGANGIVVGWETAPLDEKSAVLRGSPFVGHPVYGHVLKNRYVGGCNAASGLLDDGGHLGAGSDLVDGRWEGDKVGRLEGWKVEGWKGGRMMEDGGLKVGGWKVGTWKVEGWKVVTAEIFLSSF